LITQRHESAKKMLKWFIAQGVPLELRTPVLNCSILHVLCDNELQPPKKKRPDLLPTLRFLLFEKHLDTYDMDDRGWRPIDVAKERRNAHAVSHLRRMDQELNVEALQINHVLERAFVRTTVRELAPKNALEEAAATRWAEAQLAEINEATTAARRSKEQNAAQERAERLALNEKKRKDEAEAMRKREVEANEAAAALLAGVEAEEASAKSSGAAAAAGGGGGGSKKKKNKKKNKGKGGGNKEKEEEEGSGGVALALGGMSLAEAGGGGGGGGGGSAAAAAAVVDEEEGAVEEEKEEKAAEETPNVCVCS
jgi:hypothetical protein